MRSICFAVALLCLPASAGSHDTPATPATQRRTAPSQEEFSEVQRKLYVSDAKQRRAAIEEMALRGAEGRRALKEAMKPHLSVLGVDDYSTRKQATERLEEFGFEAYDELVQASKSSDPEVRMRARMLLDHFRIDWRKAATILAKAATVEGGRATEKDNALMRNVQLALSPKDAERLDGITKDLSRDSEEAYKKKLLKEAMDILQRGFKKVGYSFDTDEKITELGPSGAAIIARGKNLETGSPYILYIQGTGLLLRTELPTPIRFADLVDPRHVATSPKPFKDWPAFKFDLAMSDYPLAHVPTVERKEPIGRIEYLFELQHYLEQQFPADAEDIRSNLSSAIDR